MEAMGSGEDARIEDAMMRIGGDNQLLEQIVHLMAPNLRDHMRGGVSIPPEHEVAPPQLPASRAGVDHILAFFSLLLSSSSPSLGLALCSPLNHLAGGFRRLWQISRAGLECRPFRSFVRICWAIASFFDDFSMPAFLLAFLPAYIYLFIYSFIHLFV